MLEVEQSPDVHMVRGGHLQLTFRYEHDRWRHELAVRDKSGWRAVLRSVEGTPEQIVPPSPSFQDLRFERVDDEEGEFQLFGQAGRAVYSAAIRLDGKSQTISFDIAARSQRDGAARCAASRYELVPPVDAPGIPSPENVLLCLLGGTLKLSTRPPATVTPVSPETTADQYRMVDVCSDSDRAPGVAIPSRNARWQYAIRFTTLP